MWIPKGAALISSLRVDIYIVHNHITAYIPLLLWIGFDIFQAPFHDFLWFYTLLYG